MCESYKVTQSSIFCGDKAVLARGAYFGLNVLDLWRGVSCDITAILRAESIPYPRWSTWLLNLGPKTLTTGKI